MKDLKIFVEGHLGVILKPCGPLGGEGGSQKVHVSPQGGRGALWCCPRGLNTLGFFIYIFYVTRGSYFFHGRQNVIFDKD